MTSWANKEMFKRLVSAADLVIPHGTPVTTASLPKGGVRRDLSILGDGPDVGKNMKKCASNESGSGFHGFPYVKKHLLSQEVSFKGFKKLRFRISDVTQMLQEMLKPSGFMSDHLKGCAIFYWPRNGV